MKAHAPYYAESNPRFNLVAGGLAAWILAEIIGHWPVR